MGTIKIKDFSFKYPDATKSALKNIDLTINQGEFVTICGKSGCGKSTLLRNLKPTIVPHGDKCGEILYDDKDVAEITEQNLCKKIGFVHQSPENQIVTDKVWHELAFGLESLGYKTPQIRAKVAEMASYFGIQTWFHHKTSELSGGQKQLVNLASIMVMDPDVLILDEPTSQLDPISAQEFLETISKINRELGITVILSEHRLEEAFAISDRVIVLNEGSVIADGTPKEVGSILHKTNDDMFLALPTPMRVYADITDGQDFPITICDGRKWLIDYCKGIDLQTNFDNEKHNETKVSIELDDVYFRYEKDSKDVICGMSCIIHSGEIYAIMGGNGTGKTTAISVISGLLKPQRGKVKISDGTLGVLPQNPQTLFVKNSVELDLYEMLIESKLSKDEKQKMVENVTTLCDLNDLCDRHPYDLSGGEQQRLALAKILLLNPDIILLDEPTKGLDAHFKEQFAEILQSLKQSGVTIVMVSHDIEFCAQYADRCALMFDGKIVSEGTPREFFAGKSFYTTSANRMSRGIIENAILADDIVCACGKEVVKKSRKNTTYRFEKKDIKPIPKKEKSKPKNIFLGITTAILFVLTIIFFGDKFTDNRMYFVHGIEIFLAWISINSFLPYKKVQKNQPSVKKKKLTKRTLAGLLMVLIAIPITIYFGIYFLGDRKYYFISLLIMLETMLPFALVFESKKPKARELIIISVLCAIAVCGRTAFYMVQQFKPTIAIIIIAGIAFGAETGFLTGAVTAFVSNFFFGQGPWTPWQMFALGIIGFLAGLLFQKGFLQKSKTPLCIFGGFATFIIYGGIMNIANVIMYQSNINAAMIATSYSLGIPFDIIHAISTVFFLWFIAEPMTEKLDRIKVKYGLIE